MGQPEREKKSRSSSDAEVAAVCERFTMWST